MWLATVELGVGVVHVSCVEARAKRHRDEHDRHHQAVHQQGQVAHGHDTQPAEREQRDRQIGIVALISQVARLGIPRWSIQAVMGAVIAKVTTSTDSTGSSVNGSE